MFFFFKQKTAYEMRISDWSSDVCSSDLEGARHLLRLDIALRLEEGHQAGLRPKVRVDMGVQPFRQDTRQVFQQSAAGDVRERAIGRASCRERVCQYV